MLPVLAADQHLAVALDSCVGGKVTSTDFSTPRRSLVARPRRAKTNHNSIACRKQVVRHRLRRPARLTIRAIFEATSGESTRFMVPRRDQHVETTKRASACSPRTASSRQSPEATPATSKDTATEWRQDAKPHATTLWNLRQRCSHGFADRN